jgi:8-oxo-dGTP pyrophosphatase MutT (NUDIX family)
MLGDVMPADAPPAPAAVTPQPSATLVLLRDGDAALEVLLVQRSAELAVHAGAWVFPGGKLEPVDHEGAADLEAAARRAAVRETVEEIGVDVTSEPVTIAHWTTPVGAPRRFATWFFAARAGSQPPRVDGSEIHAHRWIAPAAALAEQRAGSLVLPAPTFVTLTLLSSSPARRVDDALAAWATRPPERYLPKAHVLPDGRCTLYQGDAGYEDGNLERPGARHRLYMLKSGWRFERD